MIYKKTRITSSPTLPKNIQFKMDNEQPTGSFKVRGMDYLVRQQKKKGIEEFVSSSGGNAGYSLAFVCAQLNCSATIVVPETTSARMITQMEDLGATVITHGAAWDEAHERAVEISDQLEAPYVSPFDDPLLWKGHSSIIKEAATQMKQPDRIVVAVGGGGLLCGIFDGMREVGWTKSTVVTAETQGAASFAMSFQVDQLMTFGEITSVASSLGARTIAHQALLKSRKFNVEPYIMTDKDAIDACKKFQSDFGKVVEPACGAALSYAYDMGESENTLIIICGGIGWTEEDLARY